MQPECLYPLFHFHYPFNHCSLPALVTTLVLHAIGKHTTKGIDDLVLLLPCPPRGEEYSCVRERLPFETGARKALCEYEWGAFWWSHRQGLHCVNRHVHSCACYSLVLPTCCPCRCFSFVRCSGASCPRIALLLFNFFIVDDFGIKRDWRMPNKNRIWGHGWKETSKYVLSFGEAPMKAEFQHAIRTQVSYFNKWWMPKDTSEFLKNTL